MSGVTDIVSAVIPCLDEEHAIGAVVAAVLAHGVAEVIVVDAASRDRTVERATAAGTRVVIEPRRGYGRAVQAGLAALREDASIVLFLDGGGSDPGWHPSQRVRPSSSAARAFAASAIPEACLCRRSRPGWSADASADGLWRALQRSFAVSRHPPGCVASTRHARHH
jgi:glycosyltransferase involved in cell wall biosynthesis